MVVVVVVLVCEPSSAHIFTLAMSSLDHLHLSRVSQQSTSYLYIPSHDPTHSVPSCTHNLQFSRVCARARPCLQTHTHTFRLST
uniref:Putative secreted peptide n=1 Tax=Anopheles braziliensis TaxID=58242 RepID=A0A2M3ZSB3_9DIPT